MTPDPEEARDRGRHDGADELLERLSSAPRAYLEGALENPALSERHLVLLLRNRGADESLLQRIGSDARWTRAYPVKCGLVRHPRTPTALAMNFARHLFWKDLAAVAQDPYLFPPLKRLAERILGEKLGEMALGEKITLARTAGRGLIPRLFEETQPKVLEGLLWNGKVTSSDVMAATNRLNARREVLEAIGRHPRWNTRRDIRLALLRNPRTPVAIGMAFLSGLGQEDIRALVDLPETPRALKMACKRLLRGRG